MIFADRNPTFNKYPIVAALIKSNSSSSTLLDWIFVPDLILLHL